MKSLRKAAVVALTVIAGSALAGCGDTATPTPADPLAAVEVAEAGTDQAPALEIGDSSPISVSATTTRVVKEGSGEKLADGQFVTLDFGLYSADDGGILETSYPQDPISVEFGSRRLLPGLAKGMSAQKVGSRLLIAVPPADAFGEQGNPDLKIGPTDTVLFLVDIIGATTALDEAEGEPVAPVKDLPTVEMVKDAPAKITIPAGVKPPTKLITQPLIEGAGAVVEAGQTVRIAYTGAFWDNGEIFDSSARTEDKALTTKIGIGAVIKGWDTGIVGRKVGSRLLLVVPPDEGYGPGGRGDIKGDDTLVFVVDILAAY